MAGHDNLLVLKILKFGIVNLYIFYPDTETLGEVVVTAMGIKRQSETLTYSAQTVGGKTLMTSRASI